jgi:phosphoribosylamine---glycine ligase
MRVLVVGGGAREHALVAALSRDPEVSEVHAAPGNPGIETVATLHDVDALSGHAVAALAGRLAVDLVVVGPEAPLVAGVADAVRAAGIACFGPGARAAEIEGSKAFAKEVMAAAGIPTAAAHVCQRPGDVAAALDVFGPPYVVKDDALAAGKGVVVTSDRSVAERHAASCRRVVVEEFLDGPEVSVFALSDGRTVLPMQPAQDYKRLADADVGPNTGGMGAYTPLPWAPAGLVDDVRTRVLGPAVAELARRGSPFTGLLYAGLALTAGGVRVVEFNARFGDPETQPLLEVLETPLGQVLMAAATGRLGDVGPLRWSGEAAVAVVMAAPGYPDAPRKGDLISGVAAAEALPGTHVFQAGTALGAHGLVTAGGRVLTVTATGSDLAQARDAAYRGVSRISFAGAQFRTDIALLR